MVLEYIIGPRGAEKKPWQMIFIGALYVLLAFVIASWIFPENIDMVTVFLCTFASVPVIYDALRLEEKEDIEESDEINVLVQHSRALNFFICLFIGFMLAFTILYCALPAATVEKAFSIQAKTINAVNGNAASELSRQFSSLITIFVNNFKVMLFCLLFSFVYGMGAIFILAWNASVVGVAMGSFVRLNLQHYTEVMKMAGPAAYFKAYSLGLLRYSIHGIPEMVAYFVAGLAGSIISIAVIRHDIGTKNFERIILDSSDLVLIALAILLIAALLEVFVTPLFF